MTHGIVSDTLWGEQLLHLLERPVLFGGIFFSSKVLIVTVIWKQRLNSLPTPLSLLDVFWKRSSLSQDYCQD